MKVGPPIAFEQYVYHETDWGDMAVLIPLGAKVTWDDGLGEQRFGVVVSIGSQFEQHQGTIGPPTLALRIEPDMSVEDERRRDARIRGISFEEAERHRPMEPSPGHKFLRGTG